MKTIIILTTILFFCNNISYSQTNELNINAIPLLTNRQITTLNCSNSIAPTNCNIIQNSNFIPNVPTPNNITPINDNEVTNWVSLTGSPQIYIPGFNPFNWFPALPNNFNGYASLNIGRTLPTATDPGAITVEGIGQQISSLVQGQNYQLTFLLQYKNTQVYLNNFVDIKLALMNCNTFNSLQNINYTLPQPLPATTQTVFCENSLAETGVWKKISVNFVANSNYDVITAYPYFSGINQPQGYLHIAGLQLTSLNNFSVNITSDPCNPCLKIITPSCILPDITYTWTRPDGQTFQSTTLNINTSDLVNVGNWSVITSSTTNIAQTNNNCSTNIYTPMQNSFNIVNCSGPNCINLPLVQ